MLRLYIEGKEIELNQDVQVAITRQFEDISNPTIIKNDWSKTVSIPFTSENNKTFGYIFNEDKIIVEREKSNLLPREPIRSAEWRQGQYITHSQTDWSALVNDIDTSYVRINTVSQSDNILTQQTYNTFGQCMFSFTKNPNTYFLEVAYMNPNVTSSYGGLVCYMYYDIQSLTNGITYNFYFNYNRRTYGWILEDLNLVNVVPTSGLFDNLPYTVTTSLAGSSSETPEDYLSTEKQLKLLKNGNINSASGLRLYVRVDNDERTYAIPNTGIGKLGDILALEYLPKSSNLNITSIGFGFNYLDEDNNTVTVVVRYDTTSLPNDNYYITWDFKYFVADDGKVAGELSHLFMTNYANVYWNDINNQSDNNNIGIYFNPLKKLSFDLHYDDSMLITGYAKLNEIKRHNGNGSYEVTLFGELGRLFSELSKITFDESAKDKNYVINGEQYVDFRLDRATVKSCWSKAATHHNHNLLKIGENGYDVTDIIGYSPNNSISNGFNYKSYTTSVDVSGQTVVQSISLVDVVSQPTEEVPDRLLNYSNISSDTAVGDGLLPRSMGEFRSYYQLPYIYVDKLWQIFKEKAEEITNYKFNLDTSWFNTTNEYYSDLVYMLQPSFFNNSENYTNQYTENSSNNIIHVLRCGSCDSKLDFPSTKQMTWDSINEQIPLISDSDKKTLTLNKDYYLNSNLSTQKFNIRLDIETPLVDVSTIGLLPFKGIKLTFNLVNVDTSARSEYATIFIHAPKTNNPWNIAIDVYPATYKFALNPVSVSNYQSVVNLGISAYTNSFINSISSDGLYYLECVITDVTLSNLEMYKKATLFGYDVSGNTYTEAQVSDFYFNLSSEGNTTLQTIYRYNTRSNSHVTLNRLWNNEFNLFNELLNYTKMYRLGWYVDENNKTVTIKPIREFLKENVVNGNPNVLDWTNKVDKSKDWNIKPISFEDKYVLFNYKDGETNLEKEYKTRNGYNYGELNLVTDYNFNDSTKKLFNGVSTSNNVSKSMVSLNTLLGYIQGTIIQNIYPSVSYRTLNEVFVDNLDKDDKAINIFGTYYFDRGRVRFDNDKVKNFNIPCLTDDTPTQTLTETYDYIDSSVGQLADYSTTAIYYRELSIVSRNGNMCLFNVPLNNYSYKEFPRNVKAIYDNYWKNYLDERYNTQNKVVTCYIKLTPTDYINFKFNQFVLINNQLYIVNKIFNYDVTSNQSTKVELVTVQDINGYIT